MRKLKPIFFQEPESQFVYTDVREANWYHIDVQFVIEKHLMNGIGTGQFSRNSALTRAMLVTVLWRLEGELAVNYIMPFMDVTSDEWYTEAVR